MQKHEKLILTKQELMTKTRNQFIEVPSIIETNDYLSNLPYYDLVKGYKNTLLKNRNNHFIPKLDIHLLYHIHWLDLSLSNLLLKYSLETEKHLKSELSNAVNRFGDKPERYLDKFKYRNTSSSVLSKINKDIVQDQLGKFNKFCEINDFLPSWYLIQHLSLGRVINWYSILKQPQKNEIAKSFLDTPSPLTLTTEEKKDLLRIFLNYTLEIRNKSAHGGRVLGISISENLQKPILDASGLSQFFKQSPDGKKIEDNIVNFIAITIILAGIPTFAINLLNEFIHFFEINSDSENNPLTTIGLNVYDLYKIEPTDLERLKKLITFRFNIQSQ